MQIIFNRNELAPYIARCQAFATSAGFDIKISPTGPEKGELLFRLTRDDLRMIGASTNTASLFYNIDLTDADLGSDFMFFPNSPDAITSDALSSLVKDFEARFENIPRISEPVLR